MNMNTFDRVANEEERKIEAIKRMRDWLHLSPEIIKDFRDKNKVYITCGDVPKPLNIFEMETIKKYEEELNATVYLVIRSFHNFGICDNLLCISKYKDDWNVDKHYIKRAMLHVYCVNKDYPHMSEYGLIQIKPTDNGYMRTY